MPIKNVGSEIPISDTARKTFESQEFLPNAGVDPHRNADADCEQRGDDRKFERRRKALGDQAQHRLLDLIGDAEVELRRLPDEAAELHRDWVVKTQLGAQLHPVFEAGVLSDELTDRIADEPEQHESERRDRQHDEGGFEQAPDGEGEHLVAFLRLVSLKQTGGG